MSQDSRSHFRFECDGVEVEITGSWKFVERMYRQIMRDIDRARPAEQSIQSSNTSTPKTEHNEHLVWVISCSDMMRRVYMTEPADFHDSPLDEVLDADKIGTMYVDKESLSDFLPRVADREETLWAKLTEAGRRRIAGTDST